MPRGRPPKNKGITIKSKETRIFMGFVLIGIGIGLALSNPSSGQLLLAAYNLLGDVRFVLSLMLIAWGLKLLGLKSHLTQTRTISGLSILFFTSAIFLGFLWQYVAHIYNPGLLGTSLHTFLHTYLGPYLEIALVVPLFLLSVSLISNIEFEQIADAIKSAFLGVYNGITWGFNKVVTGLTWLGRQVVKLVTGVGAAMSKTKQQAGVDGVPLIDTGPETPGAYAENPENLANLNANIPGSQQNMQHATAQQPFIQGETQVELEPKEHKPQQAASQTADQPHAHAASAQQPHTSKQPSAKINIKVGKPLYAGASIATGTLTATAGQKSSQDKKPEPDPLLERFKQNYEKTAVLVPTPPITIFDPPVSKPMDATTLQQTSQKIEQVLASFKIQAKVTRIVVGPTVVQYAINLATGTKVSRVESLAKDIAIAIAAPKGSVRIEAIAGTNLIGIEVPRPDPRIVRIREVLASEAFKDTTYELPIGIGVNVHNQPVVLNLYDMPHLLVAGATGTGKSVTLNAIIASMLVRFSPQSLRLILVDPKMVEMEPYNDIPHLLTPVITDMNQVVGALEWLLFEMQQRYKLFKKEKVRNLKEYNATAQVKLPYLVLVIDEMADLILTKRNEVETKIVRLAQLARATGIHLILATQRPSVNVITGLIKSNIPARIALGVTSGVDSRVILDQQGAETLIGKGDMLIKTPSGIKPIRVQGAFISTNEVQRLTNYLRNKAKEILEKQGRAVGAGEGARVGGVGAGVGAGIGGSAGTSAGANFGASLDSIYVQEILDYMQNGGKPEVSLERIAADPSQLSRLDPLLPQAIELVLKTRKPSASALQRYLKIGFNRAARLIDYMQELGVISPPIGNRRQILIESIEEIG